MMEYNRPPWPADNLRTPETQIQETVNYVPRLLAFVNIVTEPEKYGIQLAAIPNKPYFCQG